MGYTEFALNADQARQHWSNELAREPADSMYFKNWMGTGDDKILKIQKELEKQAGEKITVDLRMKLSGDGGEGDEPIEGTSFEEAMDFFSDSLYIDQRRKSVKTKGKMTQQRVPYSLRKEAKDALQVWFGEDYDQLIMMYLAGHRGVNSNFHVGSNWSGRANNDLSSPDSDHQVYGGDATGPADLASGDTMTRTIVERLSTKLDTMDMPPRPIKVNGEDKHILLMHPFQKHDLRTSTSDGDWLDIQQTAGSRGEKNYIYKNALGELAGIVLHQHRNVIRFSTSSTDDEATFAVAAARALLLGAHAGIVAWGGARKGMGRYSWHEETEDRGNRLVVTAGAIWGCKKSTYNSEDFGVIAVDTAASDPN